jgi:23S rRNA (pseudouridine1915-N3)-methyltransferase
MSRPAPHQNSLLSFLLGTSRAARKPAFPYTRGVQITLAHVGPQPAAADDYERLTQMYVQRCAAFARCATKAFRTEQALLEGIGKLQGRTIPVTVLLDSRGRSMGSETFAAWLGAQRDEGSQHVVFAVGPADGWSEAARKAARMLLSLGQFTVAHPLARLVMAEQIYRATTILTGHPYHTGH